MSLVPSKYYVSYEYPYFFVTGTTLSRNTDTACILLFNQNGPLFSGHGCVVIPAINSKYTSVP